mmetsp:Transcript_48824/g.97127  ORF Transcript_48824/g.97127 Transcript_48824/m.97127 type:complete len:204 (+) Transcript_48824:2-613(+)
MLLLPPLPPLRVRHTAVCVGYHGWRCFHKCSHGLPPRLRNFAGYNGRNGDSKRAVHRSACPHAHRVHAATAGCENIAQHTQRQPLQRQLMQQIPQLQQDRQLRCWRCHACHCLLYCHRWLMLPLPPPNGSEATQHWLIAAAHAPGAPRPHAARAEACCRHRQAFASMRAAFQRVSLPGLASLPWMVAFAQHFWIRYLGGRCIR